MFEFTVRHHIRKRKIPRLIYVSIRRNQCVSEWVHSNLNFGVVASVRIIPRSAICSPQDRNTPFHRWTWERDWDNWQNSIKTKENTNTELEQTNRLFMHIAHLNVLSSDTRRRQRNHKKSIDWSFVVICCPKKRTVLSSHEQNVYEKPDKHSDGKIECGTYWIEFSASSTSISPSSSSFFSYFLFLLWFREMSLCSLSSTENFWNYVVQLSRQSTMKIRKKKKNHLPHLE